MSKRTKLELKVGATNHNPRIILDQARRIVDQCGYFRAKRGQTNDRYDSRGALILSFPTASAATRVQAMIHEYCHPSVSVRAI
ncbi:hypothetical protein [Azospirillum sp. B2RO_4]|uniref:hypothetical protein n=1 Tax=Azospirillum sp. B2RO_4 TaxID=3027796 RepID=UPI003DA9B0E2